MSEFAGSLDAGVILRLLLNDVPAKHAAASKLLLSGTGQFAVADITIVELVFALEKHYSFARKNIREAVDGLLSLPNINANRELFAKALPLYVTHDGLAFEDCCLHAYAELNDAAPLWTFDKKLATHAKHARIVS